MNLLQDRNNWQILERLKVNRAWAAQLLRLFKKGKAMDTISEYFNIFYDEGLEEGFKEGRIEGRKKEREELLAKAKAASPELYGKLYALIYKSVPTEE